MALVPPEPILSEVQGIKQELSSRYRTQAALRSPPHITLHMPFKYAVEEEHKIIAALEKVEFDTFAILQKGYGAFPPRVIYIDVEGSHDLSSLQQSVTKSIRRELKIVKETYRNEGFKPHMTVAFRDLRPAMFKEAWKIFETAQVSYSWEVKSFFLLRHDGKKWGILKEFVDT